MKLTKEEAIREHRKMWYWIADETKKRKYVVSKIDYLDEFNIESITCDCFLCEYAAQQMKSLDIPVNINKTEYPYRCTACPVQWHGFNCLEKRFMTNENGLYRLWIIAKRDGKYRKAAKIAKKIAKLPAIF